MTRAPSYLPDYHVLQTTDSRPSAPPISFLASQQPATTTAACECENSTQIVDSLGRGPPPTYEEAIREDDYDYVDINHIREFGSPPSSLPPPPPTANVNPINDDDDESVMRPPSRGRLPRPPSRCSMRSQARDGTGKKGSKIKKRLGSFAFFIIQLLD